MSYEFTKLSDVPVVNSFPIGANAIIETNGKIMRCPSVGDGSSGGSGGVDNTFVVIGEYDGSTWSGINKTYAQILAAYKSGKVVELHLTTDEGGTEFVLALTAVVETLGYLFFGVVNTYDYFDGKNSYRVMCTDDDAWLFSGYDLPTKTSQLTNDSGYLTLETLPKYGGEVI